MTTASRATIMIFFLFFERQPTSKDFELWHLQTFENALDSPWLTVSLSSSRTSTCELSFSVFPEKKVLSHLFLSSTLHSRELPACLEVPVGHLLEDDLQKQISRLISWTNSWEEQSARPATASRWSWSPGTWRPACLFSPSRCSSAPVERLKVYNISRYTLSTKHTTFIKWSCSPESVPTIIWRNCACTSRIKSVRGGQNNKHILWGTEKQKQKTLSNEFLDWHRDSKQIRIWYETQKHWRLSLW